MAMDEETKAAVTEIKNKIMKLESDMQGLGAAEVSSIKAQISEFKNQLAELVGKGKKSDPLPEPDKDKTDPLADFIGG